VVIFLKEAVGKKYSQCVALPVPAVVSTFAVRLAAMGAVTPAKIEITGFGFGFFLHFLL
jgi:hypothetical protein